MATASISIPLTRLGRTGLKVSRLCLGTMTFGNAQWGCDEQTGIEILHRYRDAGGNFLDTADIYSGGISEEICGRAIRPMRNEWVVATKCGGTIGSGPNAKGLSYRHVIAACDASLRRLGTDWIDLYQVHLWDRQVPISETLGALTDLRRQGKILYLGCSNFPGWGLVMAEYEARMQMGAAFDCVQPQFSLSVRGIERELLPAARHLGIAVIPWSPLDGGLLSGKYRPGQKPPSGTRASDNAGPTWDDRFHDTHKMQVLETLLEVADRVGRSAAELALAWVCSRPGVTAPILGVRSVAQLESNLRALMPVDASVLDELTRRSETRAGYPYEFIDFFNNWVNRDVE